MIPNDFYSAWRRSLDWGVDKVLGVEDDVPELTVSELLDIDPIKIQTILNEINQKLIAIAKEKLSIIPIGDYCILTTGSDGRREKLPPKSPIELIVINSTEEVTKSVKAITESFPLMFSNEIELRDKNRVIEYQPTGKIIPTRPLDALFLHGSEPVFNSYRQAFVTEALDCTGSDLASFRKDFYKPAKRCLDFGQESKNKESVFNLNEGLLHYNGQRIKSTKYTHLRSIQYRMAADVIKLKKADLFENCPPSIIERIYWLANKKLVNFNADNIAKAYAFSLVWFHASQLQFLRGKNELHVPKELFEKVTQDIKTFNALSATLKEQK